MIDDGKYTMTYDRAGRLMAADARLPMIMRVQAVILAHLNNWGHSPFARHELTEAVNGGKWTRQRERTAEKCIGHLVTAGHAAPESTLLCVALNADHFTRKRGKGSVHDYCHEPAHRDLRRATWTQARGWDSAEMPAAGEQRPAQPAAVSVAVAQPDPWAADVIASPLPALAMAPAQSDPWAEADEASAEAESPAPADGCQHRYGGYPPSCRECGFAPAASAA